MSAIAQIQSLREFLRRHGARNGAQFYDAHSTDWLEFWYPRDGSELMIFIGVFHAPQEEERVRIFLPAADVELPDDLDAAAISVSELFGWEEVWAPPRKALEMTGLARTEGTALQQGGRMK